MDRAEIFFEGNNKTNSSSHTFGSLSTSLRWSLFLKVSTPVGRVSRQCQSNSFQLTPLFLSIHLDSLFLTRRLVKGATIIWRKRSNKRQCLSLLKRKSQEEEENHRFNVRFFYGRAGRQWEHLGRSMPQVCRIPSIYDMAIVIRLPVLKRVDGGFYLCWRASHLFAKMLFGSLTTGRNRRKTSLFWPRHATRRPSPFKVETDLIDTLTLSDGADAASWK